MNSIDIVSCRLIKDKELSSDYQITSAYSAVKLILENFNDLEREYLFVLNCDSNLVPNNISIASVGTENKSLAKVTTFFRSTILSDSTNVIMLHNHPSGKLEPSPEDERIYKKMIKAGEMLDIRVLDSIIFNYDKNFYSMETKKENQISLDNMAGEKVLDLKTNYVKDVGFVKDDVFERVVTAYIETAPLEAIIKDNSNIIKINLTNDDPKFKEAVEKGKVNINNITDYTDEETYIYKYSSFKEVFDSSVEESIISDIDSLGVVDDEGKWNFYIPPEDMKSVGLGELIKENIQEMLDENKIADNEKVLENEQ